jgi:hypothetical protein
MDQDRDHGSDVRSEHVPLHKGRAIRSDSTSKLSTTKLVTVISSIRHIIDTNAEIHIHISYLHTYVCMYIHIVAISLLPPHFFSSWNFSRTRFPNLNKTARKAKYF